MIPPNIRMIYYLALLDSIVSTEKLCHHPPLSNDLEAINTLATYAIENGFGKIPNEYFRGMVKELLQKG